jgi:hypothetical protein
LIGIEEKSKGKKIKVLYIAGVGRSGSTVIDILLGQIDGFFAGGEIQHLWERGFIDNQFCGCGHPFWQCKTWYPIIQKHFEEVDKATISEWGRMKKRLTRNRKLPYFLFIKNKSQNADLNKLLSVLGNLYGAIAEETGCRVIVDSSKSPLYLCLLELIPSVEVYILHLIRDPRAVAHSWMTPTLTADPNIPSSMPVMNPYKCSSNWNRRNLMIELMIRKIPSKYLRIRYEDFTDQPRQTLEKVILFTVETSSKFLFSSDTSFYRSTNHLISGNPCRFDINQFIEIKEDVRWKKRMSRWNKVIVSVLTFPLRFYYKY